MKSLWVDRDGSNNITAVFANRQFPGQEKVFDTDPEIIDFLASPAPLTPDEFIDSVFGDEDFGHVLFEILFELYSLIPGAPVTRDGFRALLVSKLPPPPL